MADTPSSPEQLTGQPKEQPNDMAPSGDIPCLHELRDAITDVDNQLVALLNRRAQISLAVGAHKRGDADTVIFRPGREAELFTRLVAQSKGPLPENHLRAIYREVLSSSRDLQRPQRIAYLGPEGTFSYVAGQKLLGSQALFHPQPNLEKVFQTVDAGDCDIGVVPLENSLQGSVGQSFDLFMRHKLHIRAEMYCRIRHSLLSNEGDMRSIKVVYSHPQPLAQCRGWLLHNLPDARLVPMESTAAAAHHVATEAGAAAIAHITLADTLQLNVLAQGIEDQPGNWTRFVIIGRTPCDRPGANKSSLLFSVADKPGSLMRVLNCFADRGINLRKLESRPLHGENWKYVFFADLECDMYDEAHTGVLQEAEAHCHSMRVLGCYPAGIQE